MFSRETKNFKTGTYRVSRYCPTTTFTLLSTPELKSLSALELRAEDYNTICSNTLSQIHCLYLKQAIKLSRFNTGLINQSSGQLPGSIASILKKGLGSCFEKEDYKYLFRNLETPENQTEKKTQSLYFYQDLPKTPKKVGLRINIPSSIIGPTLPLSLDRAVTDIQQQRTAQKNKNSLSFRLESRLFPPQIINHDPILDRDSTFSECNPWLELPLDSTNINQYYAPPTDSLFHLLSQNSPPTPVSSSQIDEYILPAKQEAIDWNDYFFQDHYLLRPIERQKGKTLTLSCYIFEEGEFSRSFPLSVIISKEDEVSEQVMNELSQVQRKKVYSMQTDFTKKICAVHLKLINLPASYSHNYYSRLAADQSLCIYSRFGRVSLPQEFDIHKTDFSAFQMDQFRVTGTQSWLMSQFIISFVDNGHIFESRRYQRQRIVAFLQAKYHQLKLDCELVSVGAYSGTWTMRFW